MTDYSDAIAGMDAPVISHEMGQYTVYPNFNQIAKYTGVSRAYNLERFRQRLHDAGMLDQADDFFHASGALRFFVIARRSRPTCARRISAASNCWTCRTTPAREPRWLECLDAFMDSKGSLRRSNGGSSARPRCCWRASPAMCGQSIRLHRQVEVANYGPSDLPNAVVDWRLKDAHDGIVASNTLSLYDVHQALCNRWDIFLFH